MKLNILIALCIGLLTYGLTLYFDHSAPTPPPIKNEEKTNAEQRQHTPEFTFTDINGDTHNIRDFKGKTIILNFWATWCPPCIEEFPRLLETAQKYEDDIVFIALSSDKHKTPIKRFIKRLDLRNANNVYIALDKRSAIKKDIFQSLKLPETYVIDPQQKIKDKLIGADWTKTELEEIILRH